MHDYKKRYFELFNKITDVIVTLQAIQSEAEQAIIADEHNEPNENEE